MKRLTIRSSFLTNSIFRQGLLLGIIFWLFVQIPMSLYLNRYFTQQEAFIRTSQQRAVQNLLVEHFEQSSRFGDMVNARGAALRLGSPFGLNDLGICRGAQEVLPRPIETRCISANAERVSLKSPSESVELEFKWEPPAMAARWIFLRALAASAALGLVLVLGVVLLISRRLSKLVGKLGQQIASAQSVETLTQLSSELSELKPISDALATAKSQLIASINENVQLKTEAAVGHVASQVAHDIRSPLAALSAAESDMSLLPEDTRIMVRGAVNRIRDIANHLLEKNNRRPAVRLPDVIGTDSNEAVTAQLLSSLIEVIVTEKRMQFRSHFGVEIEFTLQASSYGVFAEIQSNEFKRVLSNLINNAVEAFPQATGKILILLNNSKSMVNIVVRGF